MAKSAGFCFGVRRALEMVQTALEEKNSCISSLGPLIHNPAVVSELEEKGLKVVKNIEEIPDGRVVIRSHGVGPGIYRYAVQKQLEVIDATCPFVKNVHELAVILKEQGYQVVIIGEKEHAEVKGVLDTVDGDALIISTLEDLDHQHFELKVGIISQTTQELTNFQSLIEKILPYTKECRIFNTICLATSQRQKEVAELSELVDLMIVVGGKNSANTCRLAEISRKNGTKTHHVETADEIEFGWFSGIGKVGITAGASTPDQQINAVISKINHWGVTSSGR